MGVFLLVVLVIVILYWTHDQQQRRAGYKPRRKRQQPQAKPKSQQPQRPVQSRQPASSASSSKPVERPKTNTTPVQGSAPKPTTKAPSERPAPVVNKKKTPKPIEKDLFEGKRLTKQELIEDINETVTKLAPVFDFELPERDENGEYDASEAFNLYIRVAGKLSAGPYRTSYENWYNGNTKQHGMTYISVNVAGEIAERKFRSAYSSRWKSLPHHYEYNLHSVDLPYKGGVQIDSIIINQHGIYVFDIKSSLSALSEARSSQQQFHATGVANALAKIAVSNGASNNYWHEQNIYHNYRDNKVQLAYVIVTKGEIPEDQTEAHGIPVYTIDQALFLLANDNEIRLSKGEPYHIFKDLRPYSKGQNEKAHTYNLLKESIVEDTLNKFNAKEA